MAFLKFKLSSCKPPNLMIKETFRLNECKNFNGQITNIIDNIFLSDINGAMDDQMLQEKKITHIIDCTSIPQNDSYLKKDITYLKLNIEDTLEFSIRSSFIKAIKFIEEATKMMGNILIHCHQGISRSPSIIISYLIYSKKLSFERSLEILQRKIHSVEPNLGFIIQLQEWQAYLIEKNYNIKEMIDCQ